MYTRCTEGGGPKIHHTLDLKLQQDPKVDEMSKKYEEVLEKLKIIKAYLTDFRKIVTSAAPGVIQKCKFSKELAKMMQKEENIN